MEVSRTLALSLLIVACSFVSASQDCEGDLVEANKCQSWKGKTCEDPAGSTSEPENCIKVKRCVCPDNNLLRYNSRCYKSFECPKKSADAMSDDRVGHNFIIPGKVNAMNEVYGMHISALKLPQHWYHAVALFKILNADCAQKVKDGHARDSQHNLAINYRVPIKLVDLLTQGHEFMALFGTRIAQYFRPIGPCEVRVEKVLDLRRYKADEAYPTKQKYFLFGDSSNAYITHVPTRCKDFQQIAWLKSIPSGFDSRMLRAGEVIYLPQLNGHPVLDNSGQIVDPLTKKDYKARYDCGEGNSNRSDTPLNDLGSDDAEDQDVGCKSTDIKIDKKYPFDTRIVNILCP